MIGEADLKGFEYGGARGGGKSSGSKKVETINDIAANPLAWPLLWAGYGFAIASVVALAYTGLLAPPKDEGD